MAAWWWWGGDTPSHDVFVSLSQGNPFDNQLSVSDYEVSKSWDAQWKIWNSFQSKGNTAVERVITLTYQLTEFLLSAAIYFYGSLAH